MPRETFDRFASIDTETTGLNVEYCQVIEFGCILADLSTPLAKLPRFHRVIVHPTIHGEPYALQMNARLLRAIANRDPAYAYCKPEELAREFAYWLEQRGLNPGQRLTLAGKNFAAFDLPFLKRVPRWDELIPYRHRIIDPAMLWWEPERDGFELPSTSECKLRAEMGVEVHHTAVEDALDVVELVRRAC